MSDDIIVAIIGGITTIIAAAIVPILEKRLDKKGKGKKGKTQSANKGGGKRFRVSAFWFIPVGIVFLTLIVFLGVQHEARQNVKKILADSAEFHMNMGDQYAAMGDFANAELEYYEAIEDDNSDAFAHDKRAVALAKEGRLEEALKENMTAVSLAEDVAQYHNNKGVTLLEMGVRTAKERNEKARLQCWKNALEACKTAVELDSKVAEYHYNLSMAFHYAYDLDNAISECATALQLNPDSSEYHSFYAILLYDNGQHQNALAEARKAVELAPDNADAYYKL